MNNTTILESKNLKTYFPVRKGILMRHVGDVRAVDDVSLSVKRGETLGLVGESGCGKSTLGRTLIRLYDPTSGEVHFQGVNIARLDRAGLKAMRRNMQMIFQDPYSSLNPRHTVGKIVREPLDIHRIGTATERKAKVEELFEWVDLSASQLNRYPHEFSGGQRQRVSIARAIALNPELIIADEPVSALDVSIQAQILNLLKELQGKMGLTYIFISHDLSVIEHMCDTIAVMYLGKIVENGPRDQVLKKAYHPYTQALLKSIPVPGRTRLARETSLKGEVPSPMNPPSGCPFHPRCSEARPECKSKMPPLINKDKEHAVACWLYEE